MTLVMALAACTVNQFAIPAVAQDTSAGARPTPKPKRCFVDDIWPHWECFGQGTLYWPLDMPGQSRTQEFRAEDCQSRCFRTKGCGYFSWWPDGGCHIQSGTAERQRSGHGTVSGPRACDGTLQAAIPERCTDVLMDSRENARHGIVTLTRTMGPVQDIRAYGLGPIGDQRAVLLANALRKNAGVTRLVLSGNNIGALGAAALADALKENSALVHLDLSSNPIGESGVEAIERALQCCNLHLQTLRLARTRSSETAKMRVEALARNTERESAAATATRASGAATATASHGHSQDSGRQPDEL